MTLAAHQPSPAPQRSNETSHTDPDSKNYALQAHCALPGSFRHLGSLLWGGGYPHAPSNSSHYYALAKGPFIVPQQVGVIQQATPAKSAN